MIAELTAWILLKAFLFSILIFGPIALVIITVENRLKKTAGGTYAAAIIKFVIGVIGAGALTVLLLWLWWHQQFRLSGFVQIVIIAAFLIGLRQDWQRLRGLAGERRLAKARAAAEDARPSEFIYASEAEE